MERVLLPEGTSQTIPVTDLHRAALANPKVARARAVQNDRVLITAKKKGQTVLRTWSTDGTERAYSIEVVAASLGAHSKHLVRVAVEFLELDSNSNQENGFHWPETLSVSPAAQVIGSQAGALVTSSLGLSSAKGWLQNIVKEGKAKLLASPVLYVRASEEAEFSSGGEIPVPTTSENYGRLQQHVEWKPFGLQVKVRPETIDSYYWQSDIYVELSEINSAQAISGVPALNRRKLSTKVSSIDGETVLLSGLVRQVQSRRDEGVPLLRDIPLLGMVFKNHSMASEAHEILIAVTLSLATRRQNLETWSSFEGKFHKEDLAP